MMAFTVGDPDGGREMRFTRTQSGALTQVDTLASLPLLLHIHNPHVDVLPAGRLVAVDGDRVLAGFEGAAAAG